MFIKTVYFRIHHLHNIDYVCMPVTIFHQALSSATIKMYSVIQKELRPTPLHPHFMFTQHELSRVVQGMTLLSSKSRGRPRPRARRRNQGAGDTELESKTGSVAGAKSDPGLSFKEQAQRGGNAGKGRR